MSALRNDSLQTLGNSEQIKYNLKEWQETVTEHRNTPPATDAASMTSSRPGGIDGNSNAGPGGAGVADFFSPEIFQIVLHNPTTSHQLVRFSQSRFCGENMEFLEKVG